MAKIIYHLGTGTYFGMDDDTLVLDTDEMPPSALEGLFIDNNVAVALEYGREIVGLIAKED